MRIAGSKLAFFDINDGTGTIQVICRAKKDPPENKSWPRDSFVSAESTFSGNELSKFMRTLRKGDWYSVTGECHLASRGEPSILAREVPKLLTPSLHQIPDKLDDPETRARNRHVDMLVNPSSILPLRVRHHIERHLDDFFGLRGFIKVHTPILTAGAGGAVARPFETEATELTGQKLNLRIAPELWLKRLVVGGLTKVYEIGPAFRNEGVDATHNPEFSICEFYEAFATLDGLMDETEALLASIADHLRAQSRRTLESQRLIGPHHTAYRLPELELDVDLKGPYKRLEFIPTIQQQLKRTLPDLAAPNATVNLLEIFSDLNITSPSNPTLPRLLDTLASTYLEPLCHGPTFIIHHPAVLSPLSKHFTCPITNQTIAARAELFIEGREYANMYEEENSPFAQRQKLREQLKYRETDGEGDGRDGVDEAYLEVLEWGLPPTGGWGCGIDRLVMLFSGRERMADVLAFGSLRNVVGLGRGRGRDGRLRSVQPT